MASLAMSNPEPVADICRNRFYFGQNQVGGRNNKNDQRCQRSFN